MPDYSRPSVDVERRIDGEWQWGVTHTARPEMLAPMLPGVEYSITVKVQRTVTELERDPMFAGLYARALTIVGATLVLVTVAVVASYLPARRASHIDPAISLREV